MVLRRNILREKLDFLYYTIFVPIETVCAYLMFLSVFFTVMLREIFNIGLSWGYEIAAFWAVIIVFLAMPHNIHSNADLRVGAVYDILKGKPKAVIDVLHYFCTCFVIYGMFIAFYQYITKLGYVKLPATHFPNWFFFGTIGIGIFVSSLELIARIFDVIIAMNTAKKESSANIFIRDNEGDLV